MSVLRPDPTAHRTHTVHRAGAGAMGGFLVLFAIMSFARVGEFFTTSGPIVIGLATNGALATISLVVGAVLLGAALRGGPAASTVSLVVGVAFLLSGLGNALVLGTAMNMLGFQLSNIIFSLLVGTALLVLGAYGRVTGQLPDDSPYVSAREPRITSPEPPSDGAAERMMADAERAVAQRTATAEQLARVLAAAPFRTHEQRRDAFLSAGNGDRANR